MHDNSVVLPQPDDPNKAYLNFMRNYIKNVQNKEIAGDDDVH